MDTKSMSIQAIGRQQVASLSLLAAALAVATLAQIVQSKSMSLSQQQQPQIQLQYQNHQLVPFKSLISGEQVKAQFAHLSARPTTISSQQQQQVAKNNQSVPVSTASSLATSGAEKSASSQQINVVQLVNAIAAAAQNSPAAGGNRQQQPMTGNGTRARAGSDFEQSSASYVSEISTQPAQIGGMMTAQSRRHQAAVAPAESSEDGSGSDVYSDDESEALDEQQSGGSGTKSALRPAPMPQMSSRAASNRYHEPPSGDEQDTEQLFPQHHQPASRPRAQSRSSGGSYSGGRRPNSYRNPVADHGHDGGQQQDPAEAGARQQEAAEASEAELADKSALDEQRQAQREIILQQAQSEAKAIKEQQEALMRQQALQQQMILRRQNELEHGPIDPRGGGSGTNGSKGKQQRPTSGSGKRRNQQQQEQYYQPPAQSRSSSGSHRRQHPLDSIGSYDDQLGDSYSPTQQQEPQQPKSHLRYPMAAATGSSGPQDEAIPDDSVRRMAIVVPEANGGGNSAKYLGVSDLLPAAQHSYGIHYAPLHGHQKDYYQFAESFKKGQFHSGFKRGGHKLQISGHASQRKSHAEGHVKWSGSKGKGVSYWNYQHGDNSKKNYGGHGDDHYSHDSHDSSHNSYDSSHDSHGDSHAGYYH